MQLVHQVGLMMQVHFQIDGSTGFSLVDAEDFYQFCDPLFHRNMFQSQSHLVPLPDIDVQDPVDQFRQMPVLFLNQSGKLSYFLGFVENSRIAQGTGSHRNGGKGGFQFMGHVVDEIGLHLGQALLSKHIPECQDKYCKYQGKGKKLHDKNEPHLPQDQLGAVYEINVDPIGYFEIIPFMSKGSCQKGMAGCFWKEGSVGVYLFFVSQIHQIQFFQLNMESEFWIFASFADVISEKNLWLSVLA